MSLYRSPGKEYCIAYRSISSILISQNLNPIDHRTFTGTKFNLHITMNIRRFYHYFPITSNINQPSMLMAILNVEQGK
jgi:hypothetical protein